MMDEYVQAALKRIEDWDVQVGRPLGPSTAVKVELERMYAAGTNNALREIRKEWVNYSVSWMPVWLETVINQIGAQNEDSEPCPVCGATDPDDPQHEVRHSYQAEDMGTGWNRSN